MEWRLVPGVLLLTVVSCSQAAPQPPPAAGALPGSQIDRLIIKLVHSPASGEACILYDRGEICRELSHWPLTIQDRIIRDWEEGRRLIQIEADRWRGKDPNNPGVSELRVWIDGVPPIPHGPPQRVLNLCAACGIYKINVGKPPP